MEPRAVMPYVPLGRTDDIHNMEAMDTADLVLFMAGNQFMVMDELLEKFREEHPRVRSVFYETLPPGLELRQILAGGAWLGDRMLTGHPDVYTAVSEEAMLKLKERALVADYRLYLHNRLVIMVAEGNPRGVRTVEDMARDDVRVSEPGELEDISRHIADMYLQAGGDALRRRVLEEKVSAGTTHLTTVHHRETPERIAGGLADAGPVWATEVVEARRRGLKVESVEVGSGLDQHDRVNYFIARLAKAPNPENAARFADFILGREAQLIYERYGFVPHIAG
ncbi:MAG: substrate-binding domain-containing protein [Nitrospirota bacterium]